MFIHVVMYRLKDRSIESIARTKEILMGMEGRIPELMHIEVGVDELHSARSYDLLLLTRFVSPEAMQAYQVNPVHLEVKSYMKNAVEVSASVDYNA